MGKGAYAELLQGDCVVKPTRTLYSFREFAVHTLAASPDIGLADNPKAYTAGCDAYGPNLGTQQLPVPKIPSALNKGPIYGRSTGTKRLPYYFSSANLTPWKPRAVIGPGDPYGKTMSGPAVQQGHMVTMLRRRLKGTVGQHNANYLGRNDWYFTDAAQPIAGQPDYLGFLHPAHLIWCNKGVSEPLLANNFYEDSGTAPATSETYCKDMIPFCDPVNAYDGSGTLLGQFVGYTFMFICGWNYCKWPIPGMKPLDHHVALTPPEATPTYQFIGIDCHLYMVAQPASPGSLKSPRLNSTRFWFYNKDATTWNIADQYQYCLFGPPADDFWRFDVEFPLLSGGTETIKFGMSRLQMYMCP